MKESIMIYYGQTSTPRTYNLKQIADTIAERAVKKIELQKLTKSKKG